MIFAIAESNFVNNRALRYVVAVSMFGGYLVASVLHHSFPSFLERMQLNTAIASERERKRENETGPY